MPHHDFLVSVLFRRLFDERFQETNSLAYPWLMHIQCRQ
jgi:hypothetical protein